MVANDKSDCKPSYINLFLYDSFDNEINEAITRILHLTTKTSAALRGNYFGAAGEYQRYQETK